MVPGTERVCKEMLTATNSAATITTTAVSHYHHYHLHHHQHPIKYRTGFMTKVVSFNLPQSENGVKDALNTQEGERSPPSPPRYWECSILGGHGCGREFNPKVKETHCNFVHLTGAVNLASLSNLLIAVWCPNWSTPERGRADVLMRIFL